MPTDDSTRRAFVARTSSYALAGLPITASAINTPATGLQTAEFTITRPDGHALPVYRAQPAALQGKLPVVLLVSEIFGVHQHIADVARRFAQAGYLCLAPELFERQGDAHQQPDSQTLLREVIAKVPDAQVLGDLDACLDWALAHGGNPQRVAVTGFCYGGRITWLYAAHQPRLKAGAAWYGRLVGKASALTPHHPIDCVDALHAPVLGLYGGEDSGIPLSSVALMQTALHASKNMNATRSRFVLYRDAPHAFHADYRPSYREAAAKDAWSHCLSWFRQHGV